MILKKWEFPQRPHMLRMLSMRELYGVILERIADDLSVCYCYKKRSQEPVVDAIIDKLSYQKITLLEILLRF